MEDYNQISEKSYSEFIQSGQKISNYLKQSPTSSETSLTFLKSNHYIYFKWILGSGYELLFTLINDGFGGESYTTISFLAKNSPEFLEEVKSDPINVIKNIFNQYKEYINSQFKSKEDSNKNYNNLLEYLQSLSKQPQLSYFKYRKIYSKLNLRNPY